MRRTRHQNFLETLRNRSHKEKKAIAVGTAGGITTVIVLFWLVGLSTTFEEAASTQANVREAAKSFEMVKDQGTELYDSYEKLKQISAQQEQMMQNMPPIQQGVPQPSMQQGVQGAPTQNEEGEGLYPTFPDQSAQYQNAGTNNPQGGVGSSRELNPYISVEGETAPPSTVAPEPTQ